MVRKVTFKNDRFRKSRGGHSRWLMLFCEKCSYDLAVYQKDGPGILKRLYLDRIAPPLELTEAKAKDLIREAIGRAGAGRIGNYIHCSFSSKGTGRFLPVVGAQPTIGEVGQLEAVAEERIEFVCTRHLIETVLTAIKKVHPYEEVALDVYPLEGV